MAIVCIQGDVTLNVEGMDNVPMHQGETVLIPAVVDSVLMTGSAQLLMTTVPEKGQ